MTSGAKWTIVAVAIILGFVTLGLLTAPDQRTTSDKISDAFHSLGNGANDAASQLQDRTPAQKFDDAVKDAGEKIKNSAQP
jgi:Flp pilus assembly pilin Flp